AAMCSRCLLSFCFDCYGDHRDLHSFPTRRSSDLNLYAASVSATSVTLWWGTGPLTEQTHWRVYRDGELVAVEDFGYHLSTELTPDRKSTRLNSSHVKISYAVFCLKKKNRSRDKTS